ncbi:MAG: flagellar hook-length control protein FliK [Gallionella sp.]|nr:flagellar hook-length control protein FliK [Gallionella sp.]
MNSLPIPASSLSPSGKSANAMPANAVSPKQGAAPRNGTENDARTAGTPGREPFAILLAKQISEMDLSTEPVAEITDPSATMTVDQEVRLESAVTGPAATVTAIMLQVPQEQRTAKAELTASGSAPASNQDLSISTSDTGNAAASARMAASQLAAADTSVLNSQLKAAAIPADASSFKASDISTQKFSDHMAAQQTTALQLADVHAAEPPLPSNLSAVANTQNKLAETTQTISTPVSNSPVWANDFSQKITWMSNQQNQTASLHLNPPNLGPLDVVLKISDNQATALFTSPHGAVREAIENAIPKLREMLADNGIMLGNATVSDQPPRDRDAADTLNQGAGSNRREAEVDEKAGAGTLSEDGSRTVSRHNGMVDTFA